MDKGMAATNVTTCSTRSACPSNKITPSFLQDGNTFEFLKKHHPLPSSRYKRYCDACGMEVKGFVYHCFQTGFDLHPCCASLETHLQIHGQRLTLNKESVQNKCDLCNLKGASESTRIDDGWFYASKNKKYKCHVSCIMNLSTKSSDLTDNIFSNGSALARLELLPIVKKKRSGNDGNKYWKILKTIVTYVIAVVIGDPTLILAKFAVQGVLQLGELL